MGSNTNRRNTARTVVALVLFALACTAGGQEGEVCVGESCEASPPRLRSTDDWDKFVVQSTQSVIGFFDPSPSAPPDVAEARAEFIKAYGQGSSFKMAIVEERPEPWLGSEAIPDWLQINCGHDHATWAVVSYHTSAEGEHPDTDIDALFSNERHSPSSSPSGRVSTQASVSAFLRRSTIPLFPEARTLQDAHQARLGRSLLVFLHQGSGDPDTAAKLVGPMSAVEQSARNLRSLAAVASVDTAGDALAKDIQLEHQEEGQEYALLLFREGEDTERVPTPHTKREIERFVRRRCSRGLQEEEEA